MNRSPIKVPLVKKKNCCVTSDLRASLKNISTVIKRSALPIAVVTVNYPFFSDPA